MTEAPAPTKSGSLLFWLAVLLLPMGILLLLVKLLPAKPGKE